MLLLGGGLLDDVHVLYDGEWWGATILERVDTGIKVKFLDDGSKLLIEADDIPHRVRARRGRSQRKGVCRRVQPTNDDKTGAGEAAAATANKTVPTAAAIATATSSTAAPTAVEALWPMTCFFMHMPAHKPSTVRKLLWLEGKGTNAAICETFMGIRLDARCSVAFTPNDHDDMRVFLNWAGSAKAVPHKKTMVSGSAEEKAKAVKDAGIENAVMLSFLMALKDAATATFIDGDGLVLVCEDDLIFSGNKGNGKWFQAVARHLKGSGNPHIALLLHAHNLTDLVKDGAYGGAGVKVAYSRSELDTSKSSADLKGAPVAIAFLAKDAAAVSEYIEAKFRSSKTPWKSLDIELGVVVKAKGTKLGLTTRNRFFYHGPYGSVRLEVGGTPGK